MMSSASSQLMRSNLLVPRFWMFRSAVGIEVDPLHGETDPGRGVDPFLVGDAEGRRKSLVAGLEGLAAGVHDPGLHFLFGVLLEVAQQGGCG